MQTADLRSRRRAGEGRPRVDGNEDVGQRLRRLHRRPGQGRDAGGGGDLGQPLGLAGGEDALGERGRRLQLRRCGRQGPDLGDGDDLGRRLGLAGGGNIMGRRGLFFAGASQDDAMPVVVPISANISVICTGRPVRSWESELSI